MLIYQLKIEIKPYKPAEFLSSMLSILPGIRKEKGCIDINVYRCAERQDTCILVGEWETRQAMKKHFRTREFELLIGAAKGTWRIIRNEYIRDFQNWGL